MDLNKDLLLQMVQDGNVTVQKHPTEELYGYNYSAKTQYEKVWNEVTLQTRGLILDGQMNVVARCLKKFFNIEEHEPHEIPSLPFEVTEKMDGSCGILYWVQDTPYIATRGSFQSDQAKHATELLHTRYQHVHDKLDRNKTYVFEILYPDNMIVCNYGGLDDLVLLTAINKYTGEESLDDVGFPLVKKYDGITDYKELKEQNLPNKEGYVIRFSNGLRIKVKFEEYIKLHRILTQLSEKTILEYLREGKSIEDMINGIPDEMYSWVTTTKNHFEEQYRLIKNRAEIVYKEVRHPDRKTFAQKVMADHKDISGILFNLHDGKDINDLIWKKIR